MKHTTSAAVVSLGIFFLMSSGCVNLTSPSAANEGGGSAIAIVRWRIFEVPAEIADEFVLPNAEAGETNETRRALLRPADLASLVAAACPDVGILADETKAVAWWPYVSIAVTYIKTIETDFVSGRNGGFLGVRQLGSVREFNVEQTLYHERTRERISIEVPLHYRGSAPDGPLVFTRPFDHADGSRRSIVVAFEVLDWRQNHN